MHHILSHGQERNPKGKNYIITLGSLLVYIYMEKDEERKEAEKEGRHPRT